MDVMQSGVHYLSLSKERFKGRFYLLLLSDYNKKKPGNTLYNMAYNLRYNFPVTTRNLMYFT